MCYGGEETESTHFWKLRCFDIIIIYCSVPRDCQNKKPAMNRRWLSIALVVVVLQHDSSGEETTISSTRSAVSPPVKSTHSTTTVKSKSEAPPEQTTAVINCTISSNDTSCNTTSSTPSSQGGGMIRNLVGDNFEMYKRAFYVIVAVTGLVVVYFGIKFYM